MNLFKTRFISVFVFLFISPAMYGETTYVTDKLKVGLHEEKTLASPIIKVVSSGTTLEVIKREENLTFVREPQGATGWVDNSYLQNEAPADQQSNILKTRNTRLEKQIEELQKRISALNDKKVPNTLSELKQQYSTLQQDYKSERLRVGELQVQLAELRKRIGQDNDNESLYAEIKELEEEKKNLEVLLANALDTDAGIQSIASNVPENKRIKSNWKNLIGYLSVALLIGLIAGVYLMDYLNRRRHGGFRV